jgi:hypothetical protein
MSVKNNQCGKTKHIISNQTSNPPEPQTPLEVQTSSLETENH